MIAADLALLGAGGFLLFGMLTGLWKYRHMMRSPEAIAPPYVDIAHRTSLMYSFACVVLMLLAQRSAFSNTVNLLAVIANLLFFASAVATYTLHGLLQDTDNQRRKPHKLGNSTLPNAVIGIYMALLTAAEIGGVLVLLAGAAKTIL